MRISRQKIEEALQDLDPAARTVGKLKSSYEISSMLKPVDDGFYFSVDRLPDWILERNALVIVGSDGDPGPVVGSTVAVIVSTKDPQFLYYSIIDRYFRRRSTGVLSSMSVISKGAEIAADVEIGPFCTIGEGVTIREGSIISSHCVIESGTFIGAGVHIDAGCHVGAQGVAWVWSDDGAERIVQPQIGGVRVGEKCFIGSGSVVVRGSLNEDSEIGNGTLIAPGCRIGHGCKVGCYVHLANGVLLAGNVRIGEYTFVGSGAIFRPKVQIHDDCVVAAGAVVVRNTTRSGVVLIGMPANEREKKAEMHGVPKPRSHPLESRNGE